MDYVKKFNNFLFENSGTISATSLRIRKTPEITTDNIVGKYAQGDIVEWEEEKNGWIKTNKGWISKKYVDAKGAAKMSSDQLSKDAIRYFQKYLIHKGHKEVGHADGIWGPKTKQAAISDLKQNTSFVTDVKNYFSTNDTPENGTKVLLKLAKSNPAIKNKIEDSKDELDGSWWNDVTSSVKKGWDTLFDTEEESDKAIKEPTKDVKEPPKVANSKFNEGTFKQILMKVLPSNVVQMLYPTNLSDKSISSNQKTELGNAIKRSMKRSNNTNNGIVEYEDWGPEYVKWFDKDQPIPKTELIRRSLSDSKFQIATTVGQGVWKDHGDKIVYTDEYDWNKKGEGYSRYPSAVKVKTKGLSYIEQIRKLQKEGNLDLYRAIREIQHRESPVMAKNAPSPKMVFNFDKKDLLA